MLLNNPVYNFSEYFLIDSAKSDFIIVYKLIVE